MGPKYYLSRPAGSTSDRRRGGPLGLSGRGLACLLLLGLAVAAVVAPRHAFAIRATAVDNDGDNKLGQCETRRAPFGQVAEDVMRCFTFRYNVPAEGINRAYLHVEVGTLGGLSDTDSVVIGVGTALPECQPLQGQMPGCVTLHGGFSTGNVALNINLLNIACDATINATPQQQAAVTAQLSTGVVHLMLQDDTVVNGAELVINEGPANIPCGATNNPQNPASSGTPPASGSCAGGAVGPGRGSIPGNQLATPPFGSADPCTSVGRMTLQAGQRNVVTGQDVWVPVWMINGANVANINFEVGYDQRVVTAQRDVRRGSFLGEALGQANTEEAGVVLIAYAQTAGQNGTGSVAWIKFRAVGRPGEVTPLRLTVTSLNEPGGTILTVDRIDGLVQIVDEDGMLPGDCDGNGILSEVDALCALQMSVRLVPTNLVLDLDQNQAVNSRDAVLVLQKAVGR